MRNGRKSSATSASFSAVCPSALGGGTDGAVDLPVLFNAAGPCLTDALAEVHGQARPGVGLHGDEALEGAVRAEGAIVMRKEGGDLLQGFECSGLIMPQVARQLPR